jgi:hypothetical protein
MPLARVAMLSLLASCSGGGGGGGGVDPLVGSIWAGKPLHADVLANITLIFQSASGSAVAGTVSFERCPGMSGIGTFTGTRVGDQLDIEIESVQPVVRIECDLTLGAASIVGTSLVVESQCGGGSFGAVGVTGEFLFCRVNPLDLTGEWEGFWGGDITKLAAVSMVQAGEHFTGSLTLTGNECVATTTFEGQCRPMNGDETVLEMFGQLSGGGSLLSGQGQFQQMVLAIFHETDCATTISLRRPLPCAPRELAAPPDPFFWQMRELIFVVEPDAG